MNIYAGCDVGSLTSKAVIIRQKKIIGQAIAKSRVKPEESAERVMEKALLQAGCKLSDITYCVGTGYGRNKMSFVNKAMSEIACHAKGAQSVLPSVRTIIDIGGQDCKIIKIDNQGTVVKFVTNDKCASGTGRFLEVMAKVLEIPIDDLGTLSSKSRSPITFASTCTVWAQADVIKQINDGQKIEDVGAGINNAMANRVAILVRSLHPEKDICMTGGVAKNAGVVAALEKMIGNRIKKIKRIDPQIAGALGAALLAEIIHLDQTKPIQTGE